MVMSNLEKLYRQFGSTDPAYIHPHMHTNLLLFAIDDAMEFRLSAREFDYLIKHPRTDVNLFDKRDGNALLKILGLAGSYNIQLEAHSFDHLMKNTDLSAVNAQGETAFMLALQENAASFLTPRHIYHLFNHCDLSQVSYEGTQTLMVALNNQLFIAAEGKSRKDSLSVGQYAALYNAVQDKALFELSLDSEDQELKEIWQSTKALITIHNEKQKLEKDIKKSVSITQSTVLHKI